MDTTLDLARQLALMSDQLPPKDKEFADSLVKSATSARGCSEKQLFWLKTLLDRATGRATQAAPADVTLASVVRDLLVGSGKTLKLTFLLDDGVTLVLKLAGPASKYAGKVMVSDRVYGSGNYWGFIDGLLFHPTAKTPETVTQLLIDLAKDPAETIGEYGRLTGRCVICNTPIKDDRSMAVGYGPVCAKRLRLPY